MIIIIVNNKTVEKQKITRTIHSVESSRLLSYLTKIYTDTAQCRQKVDIFIVSIILKTKKAKSRVATRPGNLENLKMSRNFNEPGQVTEKSWIFFSESQEKI